jgi:superfamily II helicase
MRAYAHGLIYNDFKVISDDEIATVFGYMGTAPAYNDGADFSAMQTLHDNLAMAKDVLKAAYSFDDEHMNNW